MNVLIGYDGSDGARVALRCAAATRWPAGSVLHIVHVVPALQLSPITGVTHGPASEARPLITDIGHATDVLIESGIAVRPLVLTGDDPAAVLLTQARALGADLVLVGHRGHGPLATVVLGSVARELVEHARRPVLVARRTGLEHVVLAEDGSDAADRARRFVARSTIFQGARVRVVSVVEVMQPMMSGVAPTLWDETRATQRQLESEEYRSHERLAEEASRDLRLAGARTSVDIRTGDPASQIIDVASDADADVIVMGTRTRGSLARAVLGSVAREVVLRAPCSVLVVP